MTMSKKYAIIFATKILQHHSSLVRVLAKFQKLVWMLNFGVGLQYVGYNTKSIHSEMYENVDSKNILYSVVQQTSVSEDNFDLG